jgi:hypothetical protein
MIADTHRNRILAHLREVKSYAGSISHFEKQGRLAYPPARKPERLLAFPRW